MDAMRAHAKPDGAVTSEDRERHRASADASRDAGTTLAEIRAAEHDPQAAATIYATWFDPVYLYCLRRLESPEAAEDATSRIFERVLKALPTYQVDERQPGSTFRSWLFAIAHNTIVDHHRQRRFHLSLDRLRHPFGDRPLPWRNCPTLIAFPKTRRSHETPKPPCSVRSGACQSASAASSSCAWPGSPDLKSPHPSTSLPRG